jgi:tetratricopeptide (TPR) repeat protein
VTAHYGLGKVLFDAGLLQEAIKELTTAIMLDEGDFAPGYRNAEAHYTLGMAFMSDKQKEMASHEFQIAIAAYGEAIKRDPGDASAYKDRGNVMLEKSDFEGALQDYSKAIELDPAYLVAYNDRCYVRAIIGKELREAIEDCNVSLKVSPDDAATLDSRGFAYLKLGQFKEAIADYDAALALNSSQAESRYGRGIAKWKNGDVAGGKEDIAAAEKIRGNIAEDMKRYNLCPPSQ